MQIEPRPRRWPYVVTLVGLLLFCLTAPTFWDAEWLKGGDTLDDELWGYTYLGERTERRRTPRVRPNLSEAGPAAALAAEIVHSGPRFTAEWLGPSPAPTIEEVVEALNASINPGFAPPGVLDETQIGSPGATAWPSPGPEFTLPRTFSRDSWSLDPQASAAPPAEAARSSVVYSVADPLFEAAMKSLGRLAAGYVPRGRFAELPWAASRLWRWSAQVAAAARPAALAGPVVLIAPHDRLAMRPPSLGGEVRRGGVPAATAGDGMWEVPATLLDALARLSEHPYSRPWADETATRLNALCRRESLTRDDAAALLAGLTRSAAAAIPLSEAARDDRLRVELLRAHWGLARRLDRWTLLQDAEIAAATQERLATRGSLSSLMAAMPDQAHELAQIRSLSAALESYEQSRDPRIARQVVAGQQALRTDSGGLDVALADAVEQHYRNANVRVAITADLLNRLVAGERSEMQPVHDRIAGTPVRGHSMTDSARRVVLAPASGLWRMEIEATGVVASQTTSSGGIAAVHSQGQTEFAGRKSVIVDADGLQVRSASAAAHNCNRLVGVTTDFDWIPLVGPLVRGRAVDQYYAKRQRAKAEVEYKVASRAVDRLDRDASELVSRISREVDARLTKSLAEHGITVTPLEMVTTSERLVARLRIAGDSQLGGHTPRPRAPGDSLASAQVHETALTNAAVSLELDGQRLTGRELQAMLREKFPGLAQPGAAEASDETVFYFAAQDAVRIRLENGRLQLALALAGLDHEGRQSRNFIVHASYAPIVDGLAVEFAREGALGIEGRIGSIERARLHNVFNEVLSEDRRLPLVRLDDPADARWAGLMVTQLVLEDGWLGIAVGPQAGGRVAERARSLR